MLSVEGMRAEQFNDIYQKSMAVMDGLKGYGDQESLDVLILDPVVRYSASQKNMTVIFPIFDTTSGHNMAERIASAMRNYRDDPDDPENTIPAESRNEGEFLQITVSDGKDYLAALTEFLTKAKKRISPKKGGRGRGGNGKPDYTDN